MTWNFASFFIFLIYVGCPGQLTRTTTIPHGLLDILQAQKQVRHRGDDRRAHRAGKELRLLIESIPGVSIIIIGPTRGAR